MEESQTAAAGEENEKSVNELVEFGKVEDVGPEEEGTLRKGGGRREAEEVARREGKGGEGAAKRHGEGEEEKDEVVKRGEEVEKRRRRGRDGEKVEEESEGEVEEDGDDERWEGGEGGLGRRPLEGGNGRVAGEPPVKMIIWG